jgi:polar amino acid transport system substrate-binding protein
MYPNPDAYLQGFDKAEWDVAIGPRVLAPPDKVDSTQNIWNISLVYVAAPGKEFAYIASVDKSDVNVNTIRGAPSDRVLTREIKNAKIIRIPLSPTISADAADLLSYVFGADSGVGYPIAETFQGSHVLPAAMTGDFGAAFYGRLGNEAWYGALPD